MNELPSISVIMPVYNAAPYLKQAIESILSQTFSDFEFIIINDGSSDGSENIIRSYSDTRIVCLRNEQNSGLVFTLNKGIDAARGKYIARMDGDDISLPERFSKQIDFLEKNTGAMIVASTILLVDENNSETGVWKDDRKYISPRAIHSFLPINNCISHPTVFARSALLKKYKYNPAQYLSEDYDLWLRITSDGIPIYKIDEPLVRHRFLKNSFTRTTGSNHFFKLAKVKWVFVKQQIKKGNINAFMFKTVFYAGLFVLKGIGKSIKQQSGAR